MICMQTKSDELKQNIKYQFPLPPCGGILCLVSVKEYGSKKLATSPTWPITSRQTPPWSSFSSPSLVRCWVIWWIESDTQPQQTGLYSYPTHIPEFLSSNSCVHVHHNQDDSFSFMAEMGNLRVNINQHRPMIIMISPGSRSQLRFERHPRVHKMFK